MLSKRSFGIIGNRLACAPAPVTEVAIDPLAHVMRLGKTRAERPHHYVAELEASVLHRHLHESDMLGDGEDNGVRARLEYAQHRAPGVGIEGDVATIPRLAHETARQAAIGFGRVVHGE